MKHVKIPNNASIEECEVIYSICSMMLNYMTWIQQHVTNRRDRVYFQRTKQLAMDRIDVLKTKAALSYDP